MQQFITESASKVIPLSTQIQHDRVFPLKINRIPSEKLFLKKVIIPPKRPTLSDLRSKFPPIYDQGNLGSCTAMACGSIYSMMSKNLFKPSRLFIYYNERVIENSVSVDAGAYLSNGIKSLIRYGTCAEKTWPYNIEKFAILPPPAAYKEALNHKVVTAVNIEQNAKVMKTCLAAGLPFVVGIYVYESFMSNQVARTGIVPMPDTVNEDLLGGHAIVCVGYNEYTQQWLMRNSWGTNWGLKGYFYLPYNYLLSDTLSSDFWHITKMININKPVIYVKPIQPKKKVILKRKRKKMFNKMVFNI